MTQTAEGTSAVRAFIGLGSNVPTRWGDPAQTVLAAIGELARLSGIEVVRRSSVYRTEPVGPVAQADFANCVAEIRTGLPAVDLLDLCQSLETRFERQRMTALGPRTLDLDLLLYDDQVIDSDRLQVPHEQMHRRRFVLEPFAEIAGDAIHPTMGRTIEQLLAGSSDPSHVEPWTGIPAVRSRE